MRLVRVLTCLGVLMWSVTMMPACDKDQEEEVINEQPGHIPGIGDDKRPPEGEQFKLPAGISLVGKIKGRDGVSGPVSNLCKEDGVGNFVEVTMTLQNDSVGSPLTVEFPPGLVIVSTSEFFQKGFLVERVLVTIPPKPPGPGKSQCNVILHMLCLNNNQNPSEEFMEYNWGPVTSSPLLKDFISKLSGKKLLMSQYPNDPDWDDKVVDVVQDALYSLTEDDGLTERDIARINALPNK